MPVKVAIRINVRPPLAGAIPVWLALGVAVAAGLSPAAPAAPPQDERDLPAVTTWFGNTFGRTGESWVQNWITDLWVSPSGACFTASGGWDEGCREAGVYWNGQAIGDTSLGHAWGHRGGLCVGGNSTYVFTGVARRNEGGILYQRFPAEYPPPGEAWFGLLRHHTADLSPAPFPGAIPSRPRPGAFLLVNRAPNGDESAQIAGIAASDQGRLYVANPHVHSILVYDAETLAPAGTWNCDRAGHMACARDGSVWVIQKGDPANRPCILHFAPDGTRLPQEIHDLVDPTDIEFAPDGMLAVGENGPDQQIVFYGDLGGTPRRMRTFGTRGGVFAAPMPGYVSPERLAGVNGIGWDAAGNCYVGSATHGSGTDLRCFAPSGALRWKLVNQLFVDCGSVSSSDDRDVFTAREHWRFDWEHATNGLGWNWQAETCDPFRYPHDPRMVWGAATTWHRTIGGQPFLVMTDMRASRLIFFRKAEGGLWIPCVAFQYSNAGAGGRSWPENRPATGEWIWRDGNGNAEADTNEFVQPASPADLLQLWGWCVDTEGNIWQAYQDRFIRRFACGGLDKAGIPVYDYSHVDTWPVPAPFMHVERVEYDTRNDALFLAGYTMDRPREEAESGFVGRTVQRYDGWLKGARTPAWRASLPYQAGDTGDVPKSMALAGDYLFVIYMRSAFIRVWHAGTGACVGVIKPGPEVNGRSGWIDMACGLTASRRANGEYVLIAEEAMNGKNIVYRWRPDGEPPRVTFSSPAADVEVPVGSSLPLSVKIEDAGAPVQRVEYWDGDVMIAESTAAPWTATWEKVPPGRHPLNARVLDARKVLTPSRTPPTVTAGAFGKLTIDWDEQADGWWQVANAGVSEATGRMTRDRTLSLVRDGILRISGVGFEVALQVSRGIAVSNLSRDVGADLVAPDRLVFRSVPLAIDPSGCQINSRIEGLEQAPTTNARSFRLIPAPGITLVLQDGLAGSDTLRLGRDGSIAFASEFARYEFSPSAMRFKPMAVSFDPGGYTGRCTVAGLTAFDGRQGPGPATLRLMPGIWPIVIDCQPDRPRPVRVSVTVQANGQVLPVRIPFDDRTGPAPVRRFMLPKLAPETPPP